MRRTILTALAASLALPLAAASVDVSFHVPAQWSGAMAIRDAPQWVLVVMDPPQSAEGQINSTSATLATYYSAVKPHATNVVFGYDVPNNLPPSTQTFEDFFSGHLTLLSGGWKSFFVQADHLAVRLANATGDIGTLAPAQDYEAGLPGSGYPAGTVRLGLGGPMARSITLTAKASASWSLEAHGHIVVEYLNGTLACPTTCPQPRSSETHSGPSGAGVGVERLEYLRLDLQDGDLQAAGQAIAIANGGATVSMGLLGSVRLPNLQLAARCINGDCVQADGETLRSTGLLNLENLTWDGTGPQIQGQIEVESGATRLDERRLPAALLGPSIATATAVAAAGVGLWALAKWGRLLLSAIPGLNRARPLEHPTRVRLVELVRESPGLPAPELARRLGIRRASMRHHTSILLRHRVLARSGGPRDGLVINHGTYDFHVDGTDFTAAQALALLSSPGVSSIVEALGDVGEASAGDLIRLWHEKGLPALSGDRVSHHCGNLHRLGLLERRREGKTVYWSLGPGIRNVWWQVQRPRKTVTSSANAVVR